jgi:hypothetical protein
VLIKDLKVRAKYQKTYIGLAVVMIVLPIAAYVSTLLPRNAARSIGQSFSASTRLPDTCVKTKEMSGPDIKKIMAQKHEQAAI